MNRGKKPPAFVARAERAFRRVARKVRAENRKLGLRPVVWPNGNTAAKPVHRHGGLELSALRAHPSLARRSLGEDGCLPRRLVTPKAWRRRKPRRRRDLWFAPDARTEAYRDRTHYPKRKTQSGHGKILPVRERRVCRHSLV